MTDVIVALEERGHNVTLRGAHAGTTAFRLWLREGSNAQLLLALRADGRTWEIASIGVPNLDLFMQLEGLADGDVVRVIDQVAVPVARAHLLGQAPDQGREVANGPLSCPVRDGAEVPGGEGAGETGGSASSWRTNLLIPLALWGTCLGVLWFAANSEPTGSLKPGWALGGALGCFVLGGLVAHLGFALERRHRRAAG